ncbi:MAG TPA: hypothetical protein VFK94_06655 [Patescibacteria group bacterium]|nr:hypothetical protein [Patescibacteria group bacterium]
MKELLKALIEEDRRFWDPEHDLRPATKFDVHRVYGRLIEVVDLLIREDTKKQ